MADMITDSWGYNYSYWRETGSKNKTKHFRCIKRHGKGKPDCPSILRVINYKEENMKVSKTNEHNHEPDFTLNIKREINNDLKRQCIENTLDDPSKVIENVLTSNVDYKKLYEKGSSPKMSSMKMTIKRHRKRTPTKKPKTFDELLEENDECPHTGESQDHNSNENMSSINITLL